ncbi:MAG: hypothetical protein V1926_02290 [Candidatus Peregrinibacteria bacterium]
MHTYGRSRGGIAFLFVLIMGGMLFVGCTSTEERQKDALESFGQVENSASGAWLSIMREVEGIVSWGRSLIADIQGGISEAEQRIRAVQDGVGKIQEGKQLIEEGVKGNE